MVINNPFWASADDKFFNYSLAAQAGRGRAADRDSAAQGTSRTEPRNNRCAIWSFRSIGTACLPHVGEHGFLKPVDGGGWRDVHQVRGREEFFSAYDQSRDLCMMYQKAVEFTEYFRCFVVGQKKVRIMPYDPRRPHAERYLQDAARPNFMQGAAQARWKRMHSSFAARSATT